MKIKTMNLKLPSMDIKCDTGLYLIPLVLVFDEKILHYIFRHYNIILFENIESGAFQLRISH